MANKITVKKLATEAGYDLDEALLVLWDAGLENIKDISDILSGNELNKAKRILGLPSRQKLIAVEYWKEVLGLDRQELSILLSKFGFKLTENSKTIPKGAFKKLKLELHKRTHPVVIAYKEPPREEKVSEPILEWTMIGHEYGDTIIMLTREEVQKIHEALANDFAQSDDPIQPHGVKSMNLLESAVFRPHTSIGDSVKYPTIEMAAAALFHSLVHDHPFHNGNKRTALVSMLVFLDENGLVLTCKEDDLFKFVLQVAQHRLVPMYFSKLADREVLKIAKWLHENARRMEIGERVISFRKLRQILISFDCQFENGSRGTKVNITREIYRNTIWGGKSKKVLSTQIYCGGDGRDVEKETIKKVRKELELDDNHGVDSKDFYDNSSLTISEFIIKYRKTLYKLAKL